MDTEYTSIWNEYEKCKNYLDGQNLFSKSEKCHDFVDGDQWKGLKVPAGIEKPPQLNILQPILKNATALVGQHSMDITFSPLNKTANKDKYIKMCDALNKFATDTWEKLKLDSKLWDVLEDAYITGDSMMYFYWKDEEIKSEILDNVNVLFADENNPEIQEQPFILIPQRKYVRDIREEAKKNGLSKEEIEKIVADKDIDKINGNKPEIENDIKVNVVTKMWKKDGVVHIARATKNVVYQKETALSTNDGKVTLYPIAKYSWKLRKNCARGAGDIWDKIPNQIEINKGVYRFCQAVKCNAFPHKVFMETALSPQAIENLDTPGSNISVRGTVQNINNIVGYLQPASISPYAASIWQNLIDLTRSLAGAGDNLENINPEQASGSAINAAREAKALNVNNQVAAYKQFLEDIAMIWADMWKAYNIEPIIFNEQIIMPKEFANLKPSVRVDISPNTPFSKLAQETELKELFIAGHISFEEYVETLSDSSNIPKGRLKEIIEKRKEMNDNAMPNMQNGDVQGQYATTTQFNRGLGSEDNLQMPQQAMF